MDYLNYIKPELLVLLPVLNIFGAGIKKSKVPNKRIPLILGGTSVALSMMWVLSTSEICAFQQAVSAAFTAITQGVLIAGAGVYADQIRVQSKKDK